MKKYVFLFVILGVWAGLLYLGVFIFNKNSRKFDEFLIINQFNIWHYSESTWNKVDAVNREYLFDSEINEKKFKVFVNGKYYNTLMYIVNENNFEYFFDKNNKNYYIKPEDRKLSLKENTGFDVFDYRDSAISPDDMNIITDFLNEYNRTFDYLTVRKKYVIDDDKFIYILSNSPNNYTDKVEGLFNVAFYREADHNYLIYNYDYDKIKRGYDLYFSVDTKRKKPSFIVSHSYYESYGYELFEFEKDKYNKVIETIE